MPVKRHGAEVWKSFLRTGDHVAEAADQF